MNLNVTARHCEVSDALRRRVDVRVERLVRFHQRIRRVDVVFDGEGGQHGVEVRAHADRERPLVGTADGESFRAALERAMDKVGRQARRTRERRHARAVRQAPPLPLQ